MKSAVITRVWIQRVHWNQRSTCQRACTQLYLIHVAKSGCWVEVWITQTTGAETSRGGLPWDNWIICNSTSLKARFCGTVSNRGNQSIKLIKTTFTEFKSLLTQILTFYDQGCLRGLEMSFVESRGESVERTLFCISGVLTGLNIY